MSQMHKMLKQAKTMQAQVMKMQGELQKREFEGAAGGGMVKIVLNGAHQLASVKINPEVVNPRDVEMLEDLVSAAHASALEQLNAASESAYGSLTGGVPVPGL
jgi:DNA-binding YbaB/EbfC family protein